MILGGLEFVIGVKLLAAHSAHALVAKEALVVHHPLSTATHLAFNQGIKYAMTHPEVATATMIPHVPLLNPGATGAAVASSAPTNLLHAASVLAIPAKAAVTRKIFLDGLGPARKTEKALQADYARAQRVLAEIDAALAGRTGAQ
jgi:hypothetical protein